MSTRPVPRAALVLARPRLAVALAVSGGRPRPGVGVDGPEGRTRAPSCNCGGALDLCEPDEREPDRLVGVCSGCDAWVYRVPAGGRVLALELPGPAAAPAAGPSPDDSPRESGPRQPGLMMGRWDTSACLSAPLLRRAPGARAGAAGLDAGVVGRADKGPRERISGHEPLFKTLDLSSGSWLFRIDHFIIPASGLAASGNGHMDDNDDSS